VPMPAMHVTGLGPNGPEALLKMRLLCGEA